MKMVKIGALWCPGCLYINNAINKVRNEYPNLTYLEYDYDFDSEVNNYNVGDVLPVLIFINNDIEISRLKGERSYEEIINEIKKMENVHD